MLLFYAFSALVALEAQAFILDFERALELSPKYDAAYAAKVKPIFQGLKKLQIAGSHTHGNRTVFKDGPMKGELDPSILIVNPDPTEHDKTHEKALSLLGSGLDLELLAKLKALCDQENNFRFPTVYLENFLPVVPMAEHQKLAGSATQDKFLYDYLRDIPINFQKLDFSPGLVKQIEHLEKPAYRKYSLLTHYYELLRDNGTLLFKSYSFSKITDMFVRSVFSFNNAIEIVSEAEGALDYNMKNREDLLFIMRVESQLTARDKRYTPTEEETRSFHAYNPKSSRAVMQANFRMLKLSGFSHIKLQFARLNAWGWGKYLEFPDRYSVIIESKKVKAAASEEKKAETDKKEKEKELS